MHSSLTHLFCLDSFSRRKMASPGVHFIVGCTQITDVAANSSLFSSSVEDRNAYMLHLSFGPLSGLLQHTLMCSWTDTPMDLKKALSLIVNIPLEVLQLVGPRDVGILQGSQLQMWQTGVIDGDYINYVRLPVPENYNTIADCNLCGDLRHVYYGYIQIAPDQWEAVIATCVPCGGRYSNPWDLEY